MVFCALPLPCCDVFDDRTAVYQPSEYAVAVAWCTGRRHRAPLDANACPALYMRNGQV